MLADLGKYIRQNLLGIGVVIAVISFLIEALLIHSEDYHFTEAAATLVAIAAGYEKHHDKRLKDAELKKRGLTFADTLNIEFVKTWAVNRKRGIYRYCFIDGGLMIGLILTLPVALIGMMTLSDLNSLFSDLSRMLWYVVDCCLVGYLLGAGAYFIRWQRNEKRFIRLTDPLA